MDSCDIQRNSMRPFSIAAGYLPANPPINDDDGPGTDPLVDGR